MESASKILIEKKTLDSISRKYLGQGLRGNREIPDGWFNTIHILTLNDGSRAVLKVSPPPSFAVMRYERDILATEVAVHRRLAEEGILVPRVLADDPEGDFIGHPWFIMDYLDGEPLSRLRKRLPKEACTILDTQIGTQSAKVNGIKGTRFGRWKEDHSSAESWSESFNVMFDDVLADGRDRSVRLPRPEAELRALVAEAGSALDLVKEPRLVLWDLHDGNVVVGGEPATVLGFLDTDRSLWGDPLMEFYFRTLSHSTPEWHGAYVGASDLDSHGEDERQGALVRSALYDVYLGLIMVIECAYRGYSRTHEFLVRAYCSKALRGLKKTLSGNGTC